MSNVHNIRAGSSKDSEEKKSNSVEGAANASEFDIYQYIPFLLVRCQHVMHQVIRPESAMAVKSAESLTQVEFRILFIVALKGSFSPSDIAEYTFVDRAVVTRAIASLKKKNLIFSEKSTLDQRSKVISLTSLGSEISKQSISYLKEFSDHLDQSITASEKQSLMKILDKLLASAKEYPLN